MADTTLAGSNPQKIQNAIDFFKQNQGVPEWAQQKMFDYQFNPTYAVNPLDQALGKVVSDITDPDKQKAIEKAKLEMLAGFQKEQMRQAAPYKLLFELPGRITEAFALPGQTRLAGASAATQAAMQGIQAAANISSQPVAPVPRPTIQYF